MASSSVVGTLGSGRGKWRPVLGIAWTESRNTRTSDLAASAAVRWWIASCIGVVGAVMALTVHISTQIRELDSRRAVVVALARELDREAKSLEAHLAVLASDERIERIARERLGLERPAMHQRRLLP